MSKQIRRVLFFFIFLFAVNFVSAQLVGDTQTNVNPSNGLTIVYPKYDTIKLNEPFQLNIYVHNITDGTNVSSANCFLQIQNHTGHIVLSDSINYSTASQSYSLDIGAGNFSETGQFVFYLNCNDTVGGFADGRFDVTVSGLLMETSAAILYGFLMLIFLLINFLLFYTIGKLDLQNLRDEETGQIKQINLGKYLKITLIGISYGVILLTLNLINALALVVNQVPQFSGIIGSLFLIMLRLAWPWTIGIIIWLGFAISQDSKFSKEIKQRFDDAWSTTT
jgi:hypothetical protein